MQCRSLSHRHRTNVQGNVSATVILFKLFHEHLQGLDLIVNEGKIIDAGYVGTEDRFEKKGMNPIICEKGFRGHPLTGEQKHDNCKKSKVRCHVKHVSGFMEHSMGGLVFRGVGFIRASAVVAMTNLAYNIARLAQIFKYHRDWITA